MICLHGARRQAAATDWAIGSGPWHKARLHVVVVGRGEQQLKHVVGAITTTTVVGGGSGLGRTSLTRATSVPRRSVSHPDHRCCAVDFFAVVVIAIGVAVVFIVYTVATVITIVVVATANLHSPLPLMLWLRMAVLWLVCLVCLIRSRLRCLITLVDLPRPCACL
jgi:hypothetical protein